MMRVFEIQITGICISEDGNEHQLSESPLQDAWGVSRMGEFITTTVEMKELVRENRVDRQRPKTVTTPELSIVPPECRGGSQLKDRKCRSRKGSEGESEYLYHSSRYQRIAREESLGTFGMSMGRKVVWMTCDEIKYVRELLRLERFERLKGMSEA